MKKIFSLIFLNILFICNVSALENKLIFTDEGDRLYYDSSLLNKDVFMNHLDMTPGSKYQDTLTIENDSFTKYILYFKVKERTQSDVANELLDNISMKIYLDNNLIYDGSAKGLDYTNTGINLQNAISLGEFEPNKVKKMVVETKLNNNYNDQSGNNLSYIDWEFYASYDKVLSTIEPNPNTGDFQLKQTVKILVSVLIFLFILIFLLKLAEKRKLF